MHRSLSRVRCNDLMHYTGASRGRPSASRVVGGVIEREYSPRRARSSGVERSRRPSVPPSAGAAPWLAEPAGSSFAPCVALPGLAVWVFERLAADFPSRGCRGRGFGSSHGVLARKMYPGGFPLRIALIRRLRFERPSAILGLVPKLARGSPRYLGALIGRQARDGFHFGPPAVRSRAESSLRLDR